MALPIRAELPICAPRISESRSFRLTPKDLATARPRLPE
jgi:hypothetical protein